MAKQGQKFQKYTTKEREKYVKMILEGKGSYDKISKQTGVPRGTLAVWVSKYKETGSLKIKKQGRPRKVMTDKERIKQLELENEILKKFQAFLERR